MCSDSQQIFSRYGQACLLWAGCVGAGDNYNLEILRRDIRTDSNVHEYCNTYSASPVTFASSRCSSLLFPAILIGVCRPDSLMIRYPDICLCFLCDCWESSACEHFFSSNLPVEPRLQHDLQPVRHVYARHDPNRYSIAVFGSDFVRELRTGNNRTRDIMV